MTTECEHEFNVGDVNTETHQRLVGKIVEEVGACSKCGQTVRTVVSN